MSQLRLSLLCLSAMAAWGVRAAEVTVGSAEAPVSGVWSSLCPTPPTAGDSVTVWVAPEGTLTFDGAFASGRLTVRGTGAATLRVVASPTFAPGVMALGAGLSLRLEGEGTPGTLSVGAQATLTVAGKWSVRTFDVSAEGLSVRVAAGGTLRVEGDYAITSAAHGLTIEDTGHLDVGGALRVAAGTGNGNVSLRVGGTLSAAGISIARGTGVEANFSGAALLLRGDLSWEASGAAAWVAPGAAVMALKRDVALRMARLSLPAGGGPLALCAWPHTQVEFAPGALEGEGAISLAGNLGLVDVGVWRPRLAGEMMGTLRFRPQEGETMALFPLHPAASAKNLHVVSAVSDWVVDDVQEMGHGMARTLAVTSTGALTLVVNANTSWLGGAWQGGDRRPPTAGNAQVEGVTDATLALDGACALQMLAFRVNPGRRLKVDKVSGLAFRSAATVVRGGEVEVVRGDGADAEGDPLMAFGALTLTAEGTFVMREGVDVFSRSGEGTLAFAGAGRFDEATAKALFLVGGGFAKRGEGELEVRLDNSTGPAPESLTVSGGTLKLLQANHRDRAYGALTVAAGATLVHAANWGSQVAFGGTLSGSGLLRAEAHYYGGAPTRTLTLSGAAGTFAGTVECEGVGLSLRPPDGRFAGSATVRRTSARTAECALGAGLALDGALTLGAGAALRPEGIGEDAPTVGALLCEGTVAVTLPEGAGEGAALMRLRSGVASKAVAAALDVGLGWEVRAEGSAYVLRKSP